LRPNNKFYNLKLKRNRDWKSSTDFFGKIRNIFKINKKSLNRKRALINSMMTCVLTHLEIYMYNYKTKSLSLPLHWKLNSPAKKPWQGYFFLNLSRIVVVGGIILKITKKVQSWINPKKKYTWKDNRRTKIFCHS